MARSNVIRVLWGALCFGVVGLLAACQGRVFVGLPTPTPEVVALEPGEGAPVPPLGPFARVPDVPVPGQPVPIATLIPPVTTGPAFAWNETKNFLILGTDRRPTDDSWRTDTIMVVGLDQENNRAAVLSIPRDLYLAIPNYGYGRINQVDYIGERILKTEGGGPALMSEVLSQTLGIATDHWARFEMTGFIDVVDAVGGVTIYLDCPFYEPILNLNSNTWEYFTLPAGEVQMDGETAYWYVRLRLRESDIGRSQRQRQFLWGLRDQVLKTNLLPRLPMLFTAFRNSFSTDLTVVEMINLMQFGLGLDSSNVRAAGITLRELQSTVTEQGASVLVIADPMLVRNVVDGIWSAPAMVDARRANSATCPAVPDGVPNVAASAPQPTPTAIPATGTDPVTGTEGDPNAAAQPEATPAQGG